MKTPALVAVGIVALCDVALAAPATHDLDPLVVTLGLRIGSTKAQTAALAKAAKTLAKTSPDLDGDIVLAASLAKTLDKPFRSDPTIGAAVDAALALVTGDVQATRTTLVDGIAQAIITSIKTAAQADLAAADKLLAKPAAKTRAARFAALRKPLAALLTGVYELPFAGTLTATTVVTAAGAPGPPTQYASTDFTWVTIPKGTKDFVIFGDMPLDTGDRGGHITLALTQGVPKPGTYPIANGTPTIARYIHCPPAMLNCGDEYVVPQSGGSVTITSLDKVRHVAEGTFHFTLARNGSSMDSVAVTNGSFRMFYTARN